MSAASSLREFEVENSLLHLQNYCTAPWPILQAILSLLSAEDLHSLRSAHPSLRNEICSTHEFISALGKLDFSPNLNGPESWRMALWGNFSRFDVDEAGQSKRSKSLSLETGSIRRFVGELGNSRVLSILNFDYTGVDIHMMEWATSNFPCLRELSLRHCPKVPACRLLIALSSQEAVCVNLKVLRLWDNETLRFRANIDAVEELRKTYVMDVEWCLFEHSFPHPAAVMSLLCAACQRQEVILQCFACVVWRSCESCQRYYCRTCLPRPSESKDAKLEGVKQATAAIQLRTSKVCHVSLENQVDESSLDSLPDPGHAKLQPLHCSSLNPCNWYDGEHYFHEECSSVLNMTSKECQYSPGCGRWICSASRGSNCAACNSIFCEQHDPTSCRGCDKALCTRCAKVICFCCWDPIVCDECLPDRTDLWNKSLAMCSDCEFGDSQDWVVAHAVTSFVDNADDGEGSVEAA